MRSLPPALVGVFAVLSLSTSACSPDPVAPPGNPRTVITGGILTSFDRLAVARGDAASFRASLIGSDARLSSAGLTMTSRNPSVAAVSAGNGVARVHGLAVGHTWVVVQGSAAADSVEVVVQ